MSFIPSFCERPSRLPALEPILSIVVTTTSSSDTSSGVGNSELMLSDSSSKSASACRLRMLTCDLRRTMRWRRFVFSSSSRCHCRSSSSGTMSSEQRQTGPTSCPPRSRVHDPPR